MDIPKILKKVLDKNRIPRLVLMILGTFLLGLNYNVFLKPNDLIVGGTTSLAIIFNDLFGWNDQIFIYATAILLIIISFIFLGKEKTSPTIIGSILYPALVKATEFLPNYIDLGNTEMIVIALCGALISGIGTGLVFKNNFTTGGTDVLKQILSHYGKMPYSKANIYSEGLIMLAGGIFFGWQSFIYSFLTLYASGIISDRVILGISEYKTLEIITTEQTNIKKFIMENLNHGVTELDAEGGYTNTKKKVLLCAIPTREYFLATEAIKKIDPEAFVIVIDTYEIKGHKA